MAHKISKNNRRKKIRLDDGFLTEGDAYFFFAGATAAGATGFFSL